MRNHLNKIIQKKSLSGAYYFTIYSSPIRNPISYLFCFFGECLITLSALQTVNDFFWYECRSFTALDSKTQTDVQPDKKKHTEIKQQNYR